MKKPNITALGGLLYTGGDLSYVADEAAEQAFGIIEDHQIRVVIDMREEADDRELWAVDSRMRYTHLPTTDAHGHHIPHVLFDQVVGEWRRAKAAHKPVLVHCHMGINRGPSAAMAILLDEGWDPVNAFLHIVSQRPIAAVAYAQDALAAHHERNRTPADVRKRLQNRLHAAQEAHWKKNGGRIQRTIRRLHDEDFADIQRAASA